MGANLALKVSELFESIKYENIKLVAGRAGLQNMVRWVHMVESVEISRDLDGNEMIFTTGIGLKDESELIDLVKSNYEHGASGMVINLGPFISEITDEIKAFGDENAFPIFEVPWVVRMARITQKFSRMITEDDILNTKLSVAVKDAIFFPKNEDLYIGQFLANGFSQEGDYHVVILENENFRTKLLIDDVMHATNRSKKRTITAELDEKVIIVFCNCTIGEVKSGIHEINNHLLNINSQFKLYFSIGPRTRQIKELVKSYTRANKVSKIKGIFCETTNVITCDDLGIYELFLILENEKELVSFANKILKPIEDFDSVNQSNLLEVLKMYIKCDGSIAAVAECLYMHKNTVNYKISKISTILNENLTSFEVRTKLDIAIKIRNVVKE